MKTLLYFSVVLLIGCSSTTDSLTNELNLKREKNQESLYEYQKKVLYANSEYPEILLDKARFFRDINDKKNYYRFAKGAFEQYYTLQRGIFSILDKYSKKQYLQQHKKYINELFNATYSPYYKDTFNQWLNYKRTRFDYENNIILAVEKNPKIKRVWNALNRQYTTLARLNQQNTDRKILSALDKKNRRFEKQLSAYMADTFPKKTIDYKNITDLLRDNELYIDFAKTQDNYFIFVLDKSNQIIFKRFDKQETKTINDTIDATKKDIFRIDKVHKNYGKLYNLIFKKIDIKNKTSLIISPDGELNKIPFEALYDGEKYLIQKLNIRYIPSGKEFVKLYQHNNKSNNRVIVFANPSFGLNENERKESQLKGTTIETLYNETDGGKKNYFDTLTNQDEPKIIKKLYGKNAKIYLGKDATESNFFKIKSPKILHLSTHGFYLQDKTILNPMLKAGIALSGANIAVKNKKGDGIITALELSGMDLSHTELVVLSACKTGVGEIENGEGVAGLSKAFMTAGAKYIVMSLWSVPTDATGKLMKRFYENLHKGYGYSDALREAKIWWIEHKNSHPFYWSGFVGSGRD